MYSLLAISHAECPEDRGVNCATYTTSVTKEQQTRVERVRTVQLYCDSGSLCAQVRKTAQSPRNHISQVVESSLSQTFPIAVADCLAGEVFQRVTFFGFVTITQN